MIGQNKNTLKKSNKNLFSPAVFSGG